MVEKELDEEHVGVTGRPFVTIGTNFGAGLVDEVRIWDWAVGQNELDVMRHGYVPSDAFGLLAYYRFDDGGLSIEDFSRIGDLDYAVTDIPNVVGDAEHNDYVTVTNSADALSAADGFYAQADDSDDDDMPDYWESLHKVDDPSGDPDADGLANLYEYLCNSDPDDTTNGLVDYYGDGPDADGLANWEEQKFGTDPRVDDTDNDGWTDKQEVYGKQFDATFPLRRPDDDSYAGDPLNPLSPVQRQSMKFAVAGAEVSVPNQAKYALSSWTLEAWVRPTAGSAGGTIIQRTLGAGDAVNYAFGLEDDGGALRPYALFVSDTDTEVKLGGKSTFFSKLEVVSDSETWTHVAATFDQLTCTMRLFIDGMPVAERRCFEEAAFVLDDFTCPTGDGGYEAEVVIGRGFEGHIDDLRVWGAARPAGDLFGQFRRVNASALGLAHRFEVDLEDPPAHVQDIDQMLAQDHAPDRLIVALDRRLTPDEAAAVHAAVGTQAVRELPLIGAYVVEVPQGADLVDVIKQYQSRNEVRFVEPDYQLQAIDIPNDPDFSLLWGMHNEGQTGGTVDADIDAPEAWDRVTGGSEVIVAVIDTGVDYTHPDLADNMWINEEEIPGNGIDDDGNGYVDDVYGYDFYHYDGDPMDDGYHGTHCAGTIGGVGNNGVGVAGVNWNVRIMALKFLGPYGGWTSDAILAIDYAIKMGATLTSNSWGGFGYSQSLYESIARARDAGQLFVAAAGNYAWDNDGTWPAYPASYELENIISVAATDHNDQMAYFSNYGATSVDLAAPGVDIYSTFPQGQGSYGTISGTSMAAPHVAGAAGLLHSARPDVPWMEVRDFLMQGVDGLPQLEGLMVTAGRLNLNNSLAIAESRRLVAYFRADDGNGEDSIGTKLVKDLTETEDWYLTPDGRYAADLVGGAALDDGEFAETPTDFDGDGMPDWYETAQGFSIMAPDGEDDADGDTLTNYYEYLAGTDPFNPVSKAGILDQNDDSDGDGVDNLHEQLAGSHPGDPAANLDDDGLPDGSFGTADTELGMMPPTAPYYSLSPAVLRALKIKTAAATLKLPNQPRFALAGSWTVEVWVKLGQTPSADAVVLRRALDDSGDGTLSSVNYELGVGSDLKPYARFTSNAETGNVEAKVTSETVLQLGLWAHLAAVYDSVADELRIHVNDGNGIPLSTGGVEPASGEAGVAEVTAGEGLVGTIDSIRIWGIARTSFADNDTAIVNSLGTVALLPAGKVVGVTADNARSQDPNDYIRTEMEILSVSDETNDPELAVSAMDPVGDVGVQAIPAGLVAHYIFDDGGTTAQDFAVDHEDWLEGWFNAASLGADTEMIEDNTSPVLPVETDSDGDGIPDWWIDKHDLASGWWWFFFYYWGWGVADWDDDFDGLTNLYEYWSGTNPNEADSDFDGVPDAEEDFDGDGLDNLSEQVHGTRPDLVDTDDDDYADGDEIDAFTSPLHPMSQPNGTPDEMAVEKSLRLRSGGATGIPLPFPGRFAFGENAWTVAAWIRSEKATINGHIFLFEGSSGEGYRLSLEDGVPVGVIFEKDLQTGLEKKELVRVGGKDRTPALEVGKWTHIAIAWSPEDLSFRMYRNGVSLLAQQTLARPDVSFTGKAYMARGFAAGDGYVDEVRVWNYRRSQDEIEYWHKRLFPTLEILDLTRYEYGSAPQCYYRFDDGGKYIEDFAHFADRDYFLRGVTATADAAADMFGTDDADADGLPDWWMNIYGLDEYAKGEWGPFYVWNDAGTAIDGLDYYHAFTAYTSVGAWTWWSVNNQPWVSTKTSSLQYDGKWTWFMKYIELNHEPEEALFEFLDLGMDVQGFYVNGVSFPTSGTVDIASALHVGRNRVAVFTNRTSRFIRRERFYIWSNNAFTEYIYNHDLWNGKWDATLTVDGVKRIVSGDATRFDSRAVWHGVTMSELTLARGWAHFRDAMGRGLGPNDFNPEYGIPLDPDADGLETPYEYLLHTNPRNEDSDNDGVSDADEDRDEDTVTNEREFQLTSDPTLADTDDDGLLDGDEASMGTSLVHGNDPWRPRSLMFAGDAADFVEFPLQSRFALTNFTLEAWVQPDAQASFDGGYVVRRVVGTLPGKTLTNYGIRITASGFVEAYFSDQNGAPAEVVARSGVEIPRDDQTWTHVAATYDLTGNILTLYVNGQLEDAEMSGRIPIRTGPGVVFTRAGEEFEGQIDEVRFWAAPLDRFDIRQNMETTRLGIEADLVAYYRFDDGTIQEPGTDGVWDTQDADGSETGRQLGQVQDDMVISSRDWRTEWLNAATFSGTATFSAVGDTPLTDIVDSDGDGMADWWELEYFGDLATSDGTDDSDDDALNTFYEYLLGTNPLVHNAGHSNPLLRPNGDADDDGLTNVDEQDYRTHPLNADTDDDGVNDGAEVITDLTSPWHSMAHINPVVDDREFTPPRSLDLGKITEKTGILIPRGRRFAFNGAAWTLEAWVRLDTDLTGALLSYRIAGLSAMELAFTTGRPYARFQTDSGTEYKVGGSASVTALVADEWRHVAAVWDPETHSLTLYVDGVMSISRSVFGQPVNGYGQLYLGGRGTSSTGDHLSSGLVDEVRVWDGARTFDEIEQARDTLLSVGTPGLVAYYRFDDAGLSVEDFAHAYPQQSFDVNFDDYDLEADLYLATPDADNDGTADWVVRTNAKIMRGHDDQDGDGMADWWEALYVTTIDERYDGIDNDGDGAIDDLTGIFATPETNLTDTVDNDNDGVINDGPNDPAGSPEVDLPDDILLGGDSDGDGLTNLYEYYCRTNPWSADTDGDGIPDGHEDADGDGLPNASEELAGSDPRLPDTDDDGTPDGVEYAAGTDPADSLSPFKQGVLDLESGGYVELPLSRRFALDAWTVEAWVYAETVTGKAALVSRKVSGTLVNFELGLTADGKPYALFTSSYGVLVEVAATGPVVLNEWVHLAATFSVGSATPALRLFRNGELITMKGTSFVCATNGAGPAVTRIGDAAGGFAGLVDDVRLYSVELDRATIESGMRVELTGQEQGLVAYYRFDDGTSKGVNEFGHVQDFALPGDDWLNKWANAGTLRGGAEMRELTGTSEPSLSEHPFTLDEDTDMDGLPDWWEWQYFGNLDADGTGDADGDGLNDFYEYLSRTSPLEFDSDHDGTPDKKEDPDGDTLSNIDEQDYSTHPLLADTDDDGDDDAYERFQANDGFGTDPTDSLDPLVRQVGSFDGVNDYVRVRENPDLGLEAFALSFWIRPGKAGPATILEKQDAEAAYHMSNGTRVYALNYQVSLTSTNQLRFKYHKASSGFPISVTTKPTDTVGLHEWTLVIINYDHSADIIEINLLVPRGENYEIRSRKGLSGGVPVSGLGDLYIGASYVDEGADDTWAPTSHFRGDLDEIAIWNRVLTAGDPNDPAVLNDFDILYNGGMREGALLNLVGAQPPELVAYYLFDDGGDTLEDFAHSQDWLFDWKHAGVVNGSIFVAGGLRDNDKDGLPNWFELVYSKNLVIAQNALGGEFDLNPNSSNTDGDDKADGQEDFDFDKLTNVDEYRGADGSPPELGVAVFDGTAWDYQRINPDRIIVDPPTPPDADEWYFVDVKIKGQAPSGAWAGHVGDLARYVNGAWSFIDVGGEPPANPVAGSVFITGVVTEAGVGGGEEVLADDGTSPVNGDTDGDGLHDGLEVNRETLTGEPAPTNPLLVDSDDDGLSDLAEEYSSGNPLSSLEPLKQRSLKLSAGGYMEVQGRTRHALEVFTIEAWVKPETASSTGVILRKSSGGGTVNYELGLNAGKPYVLFTPITGDTSANQRVAGSVALDPATGWHHLAGVLSATTGTAGLWLYVDGQPMGRLIVGIDPMIGDGSLTIGAASQGFVGLVDDVRVWGVARTTAQIGQSNTFTLAGTENGLVAYFRMDDSEWSIPSSSPYVQAYGAEDFTQSNDFRASAIGHGAYAFVENDTPELEEVDTDGDGMPDYWEKMHGLDPEDPADATGDPDGDLLLNLDEFKCNADPNNSDTDSDGLPDNWEVTYGLHPAKADSDDNPPNDSLEDLDGDTLTNMTEYKIGTNPLLKDTDGDTLPDGWEYNYGLDPLDNGIVVVGTTITYTENGAGGDPDNDGLTNAEELLLQTHPRDADTDDDQLRDGWEVFYGWDPRLIDTDGDGTQDGVEDPDQDGLSNTGEQNNGTEPFNWDTDGDDLPDGWEVAQVRSDGLTLDPLDSTGIHGRDGDPDNDTWTNYQEFLLNTDPWVSNVADQSMDNDNDKLADWEEILHNTDPEWVDTDDDGVGDYEEVRVGTRGYDSLSKEAISNFVDLRFSNTLDYRGNKVVNMSRDQFLSVDLAELGDEGVARRHLALSSWTIEARVRVDAARLQEYMNAVDPADRLKNGDRFVIIRRGFSGNAEVNYELGLQAVVRNGSPHFYPYTRWFKTTDRLTAAKNDVITADEWVHLAGRFNAEDNTLSLFKNGVEIARKTEVTGFCPTVDLAEDPSAFIRIGEGFYGDMDEIRIWGVQDPEVQVIMGDSSAITFNNVTTGQVDNLVGVVRSTNEIGLNYDRSVMPTRGVYDASLRDRFDIVVANDDELIIDRRVTDDLWTTVSGQVGRLAHRAYYEDANGNDSWDAGEDVWLDSAAIGTQDGQYDDQLDLQVASGADGWTAQGDPTGQRAIGRAIGLYYHDANGNAVFDVGENAWLDYQNTASWYTAQRAPWARAAGLLFYLKFDDEGEHIEDFAWHADWRNQWRHALSVPPTGVKLYDGNRAPVTPTIEIVPGTADHRAARDALLRAEVVMHSSDPDDHRIIYRYRWHRTELTTGTNGVTDPRISVVDVNKNGRWDFGEDVWYEMDQLSGAVADYSYNWVDADGDGAWDSGEGDWIITDGGDIYGWQTAAGTKRSAIQKLYFHDADSSGAWNNGEDIWQDGIDITGDGVPDGTDGVYQWKIDRLVSALPGQTSSILDLGALGAEAGEYYVVSVVAMDELGAVSKTAWDYVWTTAQRSPVSPGIVSFMPAQALPLTDDDSTDLTVVLRNTNAQLSTSQLNLRWYRNHEFVRDEKPQVVAYGQTATFILEKDLLLRGDVWYFRAYTNDLQGGISTLTTRTTVIEGTTTIVGVRVVGGAVGINLGPSQPLVLVTPERPLAEDMLICLASESVDEERDYFAYYYQWSVLDTVLGAYVEAPDEINPVLLESATTAGQRWRCQVYAEDVFGNRSVTGSSNVVLIETTPAGLNAYEDNDTMDTAHRILPKNNPENLADPFVQTHAIAPANDVDWLWFIIPEDPAYEKARVILETNGGLQMWDTDHDMSSDFADTTITLFDPDGVQVYFIDDWGVMDTYGATRWARFDIELDPGIYYARVAARNTADLIRSYAVHLMIEPVPGAKGPTEPASVVITPSEPNSADDLVCTATGASSGLGEGRIKYWYVWYRDSRVAVLPPEEGQSGPGTGIKPYEGVNYELAYRRSSNVLPGTFTKAGETWSCKVYATDDNGESLGVQSSDVVIGEASWLHMVRVEKTFNDGTPSVQGDEQNVVVGWQFGATHGFDVDIDADMPPENLPSTGTLPAGRGYSMGLDPSHPAMTRDIRPFGAVTSWYIKVELGDNPVSCSILWDAVVLPITDTPLTITRVDEANDFQPIYGTTVNMLEANEVVLPLAEIESMLLRGERNVVYRINLGGGDAFQRIDLTGGWNLISFSLLPTSPNVADVFTFNGQRVNAGSVWEYRNGGYIEVSEIEPKKGYWVYCPFTSGASLTVYGLRVGGTILLVNEWNLVGTVKSVQVNSDAVTVMWYYKNGVYRRAYTANEARAAIEQGETLADESIGLQEGYGYWLYANRRANLRAE